MFNYGCLSASVLMPYHDLNSAAGQQLKYLQEMFLEEYSRLSYWANFNVGWPQAFYEK